MFLLALLAAAVSPEEEALGVRVARMSSLASILPVIEMKETEELVRSMPHLTRAQRAQLRAVAHEKAEEGSDRLFRAEGRAYAERLSLADLKAVVEFEESDAATRKRLAEPAVTIATMEALKGFNFKQEVMNAFCKEAAKACPQGTSTGK